MAQLAKGQRITGTERNKLGRELKKQYAAGMSIRELAAQTSRSYGFVHRLLSDQGAKLRGRGGATRTKSAAETGAAKAKAAKTKTAKTTATTRSAKTAKPAPKAAKKATAKSAKNSKPAKKKTAKKAAKKK